MKITPELYEQLKSIRRAYLDDDGKELLNPVPLHVHLGLKRPPTLREQIQRVLRSELSAQAASQGMETFAESQDFDVADEFDSPLPITPYEMTEEFLNLPPEPAPVAPAAGEEAPPEPSTPPAVEPSA